MANRHEAECPVCGKCTADDEDLHTLITAGCCVECYDNANFEVAEEMRRQQK